jgi:transposase InsO family protein
MLSLVELLFGWLASFLRSHRRLQAGNIVLRHQVNILRRRLAGRLRLSNVDRLVFVWLYVQLCPGRLGRLIMYLATVDWAISMPSLSSSPWIRGAPHKQLARRRRLIHHAVTAHPTAEWIAQQIVEAFPWDQAPEYLLRDRDSVYGEVVKRRLRGLGIRDRPTAPRSPKQNAYVERLIGSTRRECIDHVMVLGKGHLRRIMSMYAGYYNQARHIWPWARMRRSAGSLASLSSVGCIIATHESNFRQAQGPILRDAGMTQAADTADRMIDRLQHELSNDTPPTESQKPPG